MEKIRAILQGYHALRTSSTMCPYRPTNVYENIQHDLRLMNYLEKHMESFEAALAEYIASPSPTFLYEWIEYGISTLCRLLYDDDLYADMKKYWPLFFEGPDLYEGYEISYENTRKTIELLRKESPISKCDDPVILAIHTNIPCDCVYMCSYCEQMETAWKQKVMQRYTHPMNIFLYKEHRVPFLRVWIAAHPTYSSCLWPPTKIYHQTPRYGSQPSVWITDFAEMCAYVKEARKKYKQGGKTPIQCYDELCHDLQSLFYRLRVTDSDMILFIALWNHMDMIPLWIRYEKGRCHEILKML